MRRVRSPRFARAHNGPTAAPPSTPVKSRPPLFRPRPHLLSGPPRRPAYTRDELAPPHLLPRLSLHSGPAMLPRPRPEREINRETFLWTTRCVAFREI